MPQPAGTKLTPEQQQLATARLAVMTACTNFIKAGQLPRKRGEVVFCDFYGKGLVAIDADVRALVKPFSVSTLRNWQRGYKNEGVMAIAGAKYGKHRKGTGQIDRDEEIRDFVLGMIAQFPHASAAQVIQGMRARFAKNRVPSYEKLCRWMRTWKQENAQVHLAITNPDAWRSSYRAASGDASANVKAVNQLWEMDSSPFDVMCSDGRHNLISVVDVYSRRIMYHVTKTSTAAGVAHLIRRAILAWGVPQTLKTDNGADYVSTHVKLLCADLNIHQHLCTAHSPWEKPHVERSFHTFQHGLVELLPSYTGHNVADAQAIRSRRSFADRLSGAGEIELQMTPEQLQTFCDKWCETVYAHTPHDGLKGKTPFEVTAACRQPLVRIENERALDILLLPAAAGEGWRVVGKKGLKVESGIYDHPDLGGLEGARVFVRMDLEDVGRVYVFDEEKNFICVAVDPEIMGVSRKEIASHRREKQAKIISEARKESKALGRKVKDIALEILSHAETQTASVTAFPKASTPHESDVLEKAAYAADEIPAPAAEPVCIKAARKRAVEAVPDLTPEEMARYGFNNGDAAEFVKPKLKVLGF